MSDLLSTFSLADQRILVTGSTRGIGRSLVDACARAGAEVIVNGRDHDGVDHTVASLSRDGHRALAGAADVTDETAVVELVAEIERDHGPITGVVNNAGIQIRGPVIDFDVDDYRRILETNLVAPFLVAKAVAPSMMARGSGRIVNIGSVQSRLGRPTIVPYTVAKGGLALLTRGLCAELSPHGVNVNCVAPGYFDTELTRALVDDPEFSRWVRSRTPVGRWGRLDELNGAVVFLLSAAAGFISGQILFVDGGMTAVV
jgi:gluconate 5-dehydrogenase